MNRAPHVSYHRELSEHLDIDAPPLSEAAQDLLDARERACGVPFPESVREWYTLEATFAERAPYYNGSLIPLERLGAPYPVWTPDGGDHLLDVTDAGRLLVMIEEEDGQPLWAVDLDGSEDPPVIVRDTDQASATELSWLPHAVSFSAFLLAACWVNAWIDRIGFHGLFLQQWRRDQRLSTDDLAPLRSRFTEGPRTVNKYRGWMTSRFIGQDVTFEIDDQLADYVTGDDGTDQACDFDAFERAGRPARVRTWHIKAASDEALVRFARDLREWGLLKRLRYYTTYNKPELEAILRPLMSE